jgi:hypothetical protein
MITWAAVTAVAPELASVPGGVQTALLAMVGVMLPNPNALGDQYDAACTWLAAHLGTISQRKSGNIAGPVSSESVGQVSRSYAVPAMDSASDYSSTSYGQLFQAIVKNNANTRMVLL